MWPINAELVPPSEYRPIINGSEADPLIDAESLDDASSAPLMNKRIVPEDRHTAMCDHWPDDIDPALVMVDESFHQNRTTPLERTAKIHGYGDNP